MLLIDKYSVNSIKDIKYNISLYNKLLFNNNFNNLPNLLIHGVAGSGKSTLIKLLLQHIYGKDAIKTKKETYSISGYGNSNIDIDIRQSAYHIIIEPNNSGFDKYLIQELVNEYAKRKIINVSSMDEKKSPVSFKIVLINNVDNLSFYAQTSLRCTMEKYHETCKFILCGNQVTKILEPLRSRCLDIRIPAPTKPQLYKLLLYICYYENIDPPINVLSKIVNTCNDNTQTAIWMLEYYKCNIDIKSLSWKHYLNPIIDLVYHNNIKKINFSMNDIQKIRNIFNIILITNITGTEIMTEMLQKFVTYYPPYPEKIIFKIINIFAEFEMRLAKGKRNIMHFESLIFNILYILNLDQ
jgi:replication factor C subunit 3/5